MTPASGSAAARIGAPRPDRVPRARRVRRGLQRRPGLERRLRQPRHAKPVHRASAAPSESVDPEVAIADFQACMKEHGVDVRIAIAGEGGNGPSTGEFLGSTNAGEAQPNGAKPAGGSQRRWRRPRRRARTCCRPG